MASSYSLGRHFEAFVQDQLATGRYGNASEVLRDALRLMEEREVKLAALRTRIDHSIEMGGAHDEEALIRELGQEDVRLAQEGY